MFIAGLGEIGRALFFVELEILGGRARDHLINGYIEIVPVVGSPRNDQRRPSLIDENRIDLVDDRIMMAALSHLGKLVFHVIAEIVEAELIVGAIGNIGGIG